MANPQTAFEWLEHLRNCPADEAMQIARAWERDPPGFEKRRLALGDPQQDVDDLVHRCRELREQVRGLTATHLLGWAQAAQHTPSQPIGDQEPDEPPGVDPPRFKTGIPRLDIQVGGGCYGMTVVAAEPKCGKSILALSTAIEAAREGWRTLYLNAELSRSEMSKRIRRYCGGHVPEVVLDHLSVHPCELGVSVPGVLEKLRSRMDIADTKALIVADSINRIVDMSQSDGSDHGYWHAMREWQEWLRRCSQISEHQLCSLVVSELNAGGHIKGRSLEYASDLCVRIMPAKDQHAGIFEIDVPYARSSAAGHIGTFILNWQNGSFDYVDPDEGAGGFDMPEL